MSNSSLWGYFIAIITSFTFAIYIIPRKLSKIHSALYLFWFSFGLLFTASLSYVLQFIFLAAPEIITLKNFFYSAPIGMMWAIGSHSLIQGIDSIGISKSNQWKNLQGPIALLLSLLLLGEAAQTKIFYVLLAGATIFGSALFLNISDKDKASNTRGILFSFTAAISFGIAAVYSKFLVNNSYIFTQLFSVGVFFTLTTLIITFKRVVKECVPNKKELINPLLGGLLFTLSSFMMLTTYRYLPASIGYTIIQLNALWVILAGVIIFKEINLKIHYKRITAGLILAVLAIAILFFAIK